MKLRTWWKIGTFAVGVYLLVRRARKGSAHRADTTEARVA